MAIPLAWGHLFNFYHPRASRVEHAVSVAIRLGKKTASSIMPIALFPNISQGTFLGFVPTVGTSATWLHSDGEAKTLEVLSVQDPRDPANWTQAAGS